MKTYKNRTPSIYVDFKWASYLCVLPCEEYSLEPVWGEGLHIATSMPIHIGLFKNYWLHFHWVSIHIIWMHKSVKIMFCLPCSKNIIPLLHVPSFWVIYEHCQMKTLFSKTATIAAAVLNLCTKEFCALCYQCFTVILLLPLCLVYTHISAHFFYSL